MVSMQNSSLSNFVERYDTLTAKSWMDNLGYFPVYTVSCYIWIIIAMREIMKTREKVQLRVVLFLWNAALSILSAIGAIAMFPEITEELLSNGFKNMGCNSDIFRIRRKAGFWMFVFTWSKFWELGDTLFIVLKKRKLLFLHWYHHMSVLVVSWYCFTSFLGVFAVCSLMNFFVHSFMYGYYALQSLNMKIPRLISKTLTILQIVQMIIGTFLVIKTQRLQFLTNSCSGYGSFALNSLLSGFVTFFILFLKFFYEAYMAPMKVPKDKKSQ